MLLQHHQNLHNRPYSHATDKRIETTTYWTKAT